MEMSSEQTENIIQDYLSNGYTEHKPSSMNRANRFFQKCVRGKDPKTGEDNEKLYFLNVYYYHYQVHLEWHTAFQVDVQLYGGSLFNVSYFDGHDRKKMETFFAKMFKVMELNIDEDNND